jgi:hypothetical protein
LASAGLSSIDDSEVFEELFEDSKGELSWVDGDESVVICLRRAGACWRAVVVAIVVEVGCRIGADVEFCGGDVRAGALVGTQAAC